MYKFKNFYTVNNIKSLIFKSLIIKKFYFYNSDLFNKIIKLYEKKSNFFFE